MILGIVQARLGSHRLPKKCLMDIAGKPMIAHVIERAKAIRGVDRVVLATTCSDTVDFVDALDGLTTVVAYDVPEDDVLARFQRAAEEFGADTVVRITGDCPLLAPDVCAGVIVHYSGSGCDYAWNDTEHYFYDGTDCEVFNRESLEAAALCARSSDDREHVTKWIRRNRRVATVLPIPYCPQPALQKVSVDTAEDLDRVRAIYRHLKPGDFSLAGTIEAARKAGVLND